MEGKTKGYKNHPQLIRFKNFSKPKEAINSYLYFIFLESENRGYNFVESKINGSKLKKIISVNRGQIEFELEHLLKKLKNRNLKKFNEMKKFKQTKIKVNPVFKIVKGKIEPWEKTRL